MNPKPQSVFSSARDVVQPPLTLPAGLSFDARLKMEGLAFLAALPPASVPAAFLDPQYRGVLDRLAYGNEGEGRGTARAGLAQMTVEIPRFVAAIERILLPSGHLFLWLDKFHLCSDFRDWFAATSLAAVDLVTWDKGRMGMGYRTRRQSEYVVVLQKAPCRAKGVWQAHDIPDVWAETVARGGGGVHPKPVGLQARLIAAVTRPGDVVVDPAAGSFSVLEACRQTGRTFLGCDIAG